MTDRRDDYQLMPTLKMPVGSTSLVETPIVPKKSIAGRALVAVVAIMTFLASITTGAVMLVRTSASEWQSDVAREVTIQIRPSADRNIESELRRAAEIARAIPGVAEVRPYSKEESARLLEPWLGTGLQLDALPVPRLIIVRISPDATPDLALLRRTLAEQIAGVTLDDHRGWIDRMRTMARTAVAIGIGVFVLMMVATMLSVTFATRGAMATNRPIVEVLHYVGAKDGFIAGQFQRHFLALGLEGGLIGGGSAILLFVIAGLVNEWYLGTAGSDQVSALFGTFSIGLFGYAALVVQIGLVAVVTALTSRFTVTRVLQTIE